MRLKFHIKYAVGYYWKALSALSVLLSIFLVFGLPTRIMQASFSIKILMLIGLFIITFVLTVAWYALRKKKSIVTIADGKRIVVKSGDIFNQNGNIVIPVNLYFDTLIKDGLIAETSVHGQFVKRIFGGNVVELDRQLDNQLKNASFENVSRAEGKTKKYSYGTIAKILRDGKTYFLVALSDFDADNHAFCSAENYFFVLTQLARYVGKNSEGNSVSMPVIGSGLSRINSSLNSCIRNIVQVFRTEAPAMIGDVQIIVKESFLYKVNMKIE